MSPKSGLVRCGRTGFRHHLPRSLAALATRGRKPPRRTARHLPDSDLADSRLADSRLADSGLADLRLPASSPAQPAKADAAKIHHLRNANPSWPAYARFASPAKPYPTKTVRSSAPAFLRWGWAGGPA